MSYVSPVVENDFKDRLNKCVDIIKNSSIKYQSFGIFGSYARNDYKASSDIDFCIIVPEKPESPPGRAPDDLSGFGCCTESPNEHTADHAGACKDQPQDP